VINRRSTGQIAGIVGAYGNIGGLVLSSILYFTISPAHKAGNVPLVFLAIAGSALVVAVLCRLLPSDAPAVAEERKAPVVLETGLGVPVEAVVH
jgi:MFS transporter, NNP family, nitrate/nitrite transporter